MGLHQRGTDTSARRQWYFVSMLTVSLYALLAVFMTYPLCFHLTQWIPRHDNDVWTALWNNWWFRQALSTGGNYFHTPFLFYPRGVSLATHSNSLLFSALSALWVPLLGPLGSFNFTFLLTFVVGAWGMYLLVYDTTAHPLAAFVGGLTYAFAPYYLTQAMSHPNLGSVQWFPYTALLLRRVIRDGRIRDGIGAGVFFSLTVWSGLHLGLLSGLWILLFLLWAFLTRPDVRRPAVLWALVGSTLTVVLLSTPVVLPVLKALPRDHGDILRIDHMKGQTDLLAYVLPPRYHPLWKSLVTPIYSRFPKNRKWMPYLGGTPLVLAIYAATKERRKVCFWWMSGILWITLALGAFPRINGHTYPDIQLPYAFIERMFPFSTLRSADRFNLLVPLSLAPLVGAGMGRLKRQGWGILAAVLILFEYLCIPIPAAPPLSISPFLLRMRATPQSYAVLDLPMGRHPSKRWMFLQTIHGKPIVEGMVARPPSDAYDFIESVPLLHALYHDYNLPPSPPAHDLCTLAENGVRYILIHPDLASPEEVQRWTSRFSFPPFYQDDSLIVFATLDGCKAPGVSAHR